MVEVPLPDALFMTGQLSTRAEMMISISDAERNYMLSRGTIPHRSLLTLMGKSQRQFFRCFPLMLTQGSTDQFATLVSFICQQEVPVIVAS